MWLAVTEQGFDSPQVHRKGRDAGVVERGGLENRYTPKGYRRFESSSRRQQRSDIFKQTSLHGI